MGLYKLKYASFLVVKCFLKENVMLYT